MIDVAGMYNIFNPDDLGNNSTVIFCGNFPSICEAILSKFADLDPTVDNYDRANSILSHFPSGAGWRNVMHYGQIIRDAQFQRYDWGTLKNIELYGSDKAPKYPLQDISYDLPFAFFSGTLDVLGNPTDVAWLSKELGERIVFEKSYPLGHMSFAIARDMSFMNDVLTVMSKYSQ